VLDVARGDRLRAAPSVRIEMLNPDPTPRPTDDPNERSIVLLAEYGEMTFLLTGDAGRAAEREMLRSFGPDYLEAEVLKVGHHGGRGSSSPEFLAAVQPEVALISASRNNRFGHPHPEVVSRLEGLKASLYDTSLQGTIELRTDGERLWIRPTRSGGGGP